MSRQPSSLELKPPHSVIWPKCLTLPALTTLSISPISSWFYEIKTKHQNIHETTLFFLPELIFVEHFLNLFLVFVSCITHITYVKAVASSTKTCRNSRAVHKRSVWAKFPFSTMLSGGEHCNIVLVL